MIEKMNEEFRVEIIDLLLNRKIFKINSKEGVAMSIYENNNCTFNFSSMLSTTFHLDEIKKDSELYNIMGIISIESFPEWQNREVV